MRLPYRAIAVDLDGTLLNDNKEVTPRQAEALDRYRKMGGKIIVSTTHSPGFSRYMTAPEGLTFDGEVLCSGAIVMDGTEIASCKMIPGEEMAAMYAALRAIGCTRFCATDETGNSYANFNSKTFWPRNRLLPLRDDFSFPSVKVLIPTDERVTFEKAQAICPANADITAIDDGTLLLITPARTNKWTGIRVLLDRWGMTAEDVAAFGDDRNDLPMIMGAGCGVAMGNAIPEVLAAANTVTSTNNEDGVAVFLEKCGI